MNLLQLSCLMAVLLAAHAAVEPVKKEFVDEVIKSEHKRAIILGAPIVRAAVVPVVGPLGFVRPAVVPVVARVPVVVPFIGKRDTEAMEKKETTEKKEDMTLEEPIKKEIVDKKDFETIKREEMMEKKDSMDKKEDLMTLEEPVKKEIIDKRIVHGAEDMKRDSMDKKEDLMTLEEPTKKEIVDKKDFETIKREMISEPIKKETASLVEEPIFKKEEDAESIVRTVREFITKRTIEEPITLAEIKKSLAETAPLKKRFDAEFTSDIVSTQPKTFAVEKTFKRTVVEPVAITDEDRAIVKRFEELRRNDFVKMRREGVERRRAIIEGMKLRRSMKPVEDVKMI